MNMYQEAALIGEPKISPSKYISKNLLKNEIKINIIHQKQIYGEINAHFQN